MICEWGTCTACALLPMLKGRLKNHIDLGCNNRLVEFNVFLQSLPNLSVISSAGLVARPTPMPITWYLVGRSCEWPEISSMRVTK